VAGSARSELVGLLVRVERSARSYSSERKQSRAGLRGNAGRMTSPFSMAAGKETEEHTAARVPMTFTSFDTSLRARVDWLPQNIPSGEITSPPDNFLHGQRNRPCGETIRVRAPAWDPCRTRSVPVHNTPLRRRWRATRTRRRRSADRMPGLRRAATREVLRWRAHR